MLTNTSASGVFAPFVEWAPLAQDVWDDQHECKISDIVDRNVTSPSNVMTNTSTSRVLVAFVERKRHWP